MHTNPGLPDPLDLDGAAVARQVAQLPDLQLGEGLWRVGQRSFVVRHQVTDAELILFDTSARMTGEQ